MKQHPLRPLLQNARTFDKKLRILVVVPPSIPLPAVTYGGIERIAFSLITHLSQKGHEVILLGHPDSSGPFTVIPHNVANAKYYTSSGYKNLISIRNIIQQIQPDLVHDFCNPPLSLFCPFHIPLIWSLPSFPRMRDTYPLLWRQPRTLIVGNAHHVSKQIPCCLQKRTIYNSVGYEKYQFSGQIPSQAPLVFLGRIEPIKGAHIAIRIARKTGNKLIIAGNLLPQFQDYFDRDIAPHLSDSIRYVGPIDDIQKNDLLCNAKAFIFPLQWHEPFGITVLESMACGTPVLAFPYGSMPELIRHGVNGFLCNSEDEMADMVHSIPLISRETCRITVEENFSPQTMGEYYLNAYYELLSERAPRSL